MPSKKVTLLDWVFEYIHALQYDHWPENHTQQTTTERNFSLQLQKIVSFHDKLLQNVARKCAADRPRTPQHHVLELSISTNTISVKTTLTAPTARLRRWAATTAPSDHRTVVVKDHSNPHSNPPPPRAPALSCPWEHLSVLSAESTHSELTTFRESTRIGD